MFVGLQTTQMFIGLGIGVYVFFLKILDQPVQHSWGNLALVNIMYFSYLYLFSVFFYNAYIAKKPQLTDRKKQWMKS